MRFIFFVCLSFIISSAFSQKGWQASRLLYKDQQITVEVEYYIPKKTCTGGRQFKYRYKVTGKYHTSPLYINWRMDYKDCNGFSYYQQNSLPIWEDAFEDISSGVFVESIDYLFSADKLERTHYAIETSRVTKTGSGFAQSRPPTGIIGNDKLYYGQSQVLEVEGGALGSGSEWVWYKGKCGVGKPIGKGQRITISPKEHTTYFVRAEDYNGSTNCVQKRIEVDEKSLAPSAIMGNPNICVGETCILKVSGGSLGKEAQWAWYEGRCGGKRIGTGESIKIQPSANETYFVRAESNINITGCAQIDVSVFERAIAPTGIKKNKNTAICEGDDVRLMAQGGYLPSGGTYKWSANNCGGAPLGEGESIIVSPVQTTTYYLWTESPCNQTECISVVVEVNQKPTQPYGILGPTSVDKGKKTALTVKGGNLGADGQWYWYKNSCTNGTLVGKGETITIKPRKETTYYVKGKGSCGQTNCISHKITTEKRHQFSQEYDKPNKFLALGVGLGLEYISLNDLANYASVSSPNTIIGSDSIDMRGLGISGEILFYPLMKENISWGFNSTFAVGTSLYVFNGGKPSSGSTDKDKYYFWDANIESELALGFRVFKLLLKARRKYRHNNFNRTSTSNVKYTYQKDLHQESLSAGFRIGRYHATGSNKAKTLDIYYSLSQFSNNNKWFDYKPLGEWQPGFGLSWWVQNTLRINFEATLAISQNDLNYSNPNYDRASYQLSIRWVRNWFY